MPARVLIRHRGPGAHPPSHGADAGAIPARHVGHLPPPRAALLPVLPGLPRQLRVAQLPRVAGAQPSLARAAPQRVPALRVRLLPLRQPWRRRLLSPSVQPSHGRVQPVMRHAPAHQPSPTTLASERLRPAETVLLTAVDARARLADNGDPASAALGSRRPPPWTRV
eukprot:7390003-Prymnesium_polylepis.1